jgi:CheY-like chemotaxis protein
MSKTILIVDDEADVRTFLSAVCKKRGYRVVTAQNGAEGLELARSERPALVVLDLVMPKQSGAEFYSALAKSGEFADTPIIVVSGLAARDAVVDDAVAVFDKPINPGEFIAAIDKALA